MTREIRKQIPTIAVAFCGVVFRVGTAVALAHEGRTSAMMACEHGQAARTTPARQPTSLTFHAEEDLLALATQAVGEGVLGEDDVDRIMDMYRTACRSGVPIAAKLGDTGYYVVRDGDDRYYPAGWAHVLCDLEGGGSAVARKKRKTGYREVVCKVRKIREAPLIL